MTEKPAYTVAEVAALMGLSRHTVERVFRNERGVLLMGRSKTEPDKGPTRGKRRYQTIRIPRAVYERVIGRLAVR